MRRSLVILLCLVTSLVGCGALEGRLHHTRLMAWEQQEGSAPALPVGLHDRTDLVTGIESGNPVPLNGPPWIKVGALDGQPNTLNIIWMGGACISSIHIDLAREGEKFVLALQELKSVGGMLACPAVGVLRSVVLRLVEPVPPGDVRLDYTIV